MRSSFQHIIWSSILLIFVSAVCGCVKGTPNSTSSTPLCYISVMNEAPYSSATDIYFNGTLVSPSGGIMPGEYSSQYGSVKPGVYTVDFKVAGTDSLLCELPSVTYDTSNFYTLIFFNTAPKSPAVSAANILDNFSSVTAANAYYRFFNLSPDVPSVDLYLSGTGAQFSRMPGDNITDLAYDEFQAVNPMLYNIQVMKAGTDSVLATAMSTSLAAGTVYTIFLQGKSDSLSLKVLPALY